MKTHMTIKEASKLAGKHPDTIRALIRGNKEQSLKDSKGRVLISTAFLMSHYSISTDTKQSVETTEQVNPATTEQVATDTKQSANKATEQATEGHRAGVNDTTSQLIKALTTELEAKNEIIRQQQETIQQVVNQQQQLSGLLLQSTNEGRQAGNSQKSEPESDIFTPVNPIEGKVKEGKVKKEKEIKGKAHSTNKKKRWWNRK